MKQLFLDVNSGNVELVDTPCPTNKKNYLLVETLYSVVSAGTERMLASFGGKNLVQKALDRPDQVKKVLEKVSTDGAITTIEAAFTRLKEAMPMGYSAVGRVVSCGDGVTGYEKGDFVCMVGQAYHSEVNRVNKNLVSKIPGNIEDIRPYAFCALGGIALEAIHQTTLVPGESVGVIGMGLLGNVLTRILHAYGCDVIGFDITDKVMPGTKVKAFIQSQDENAEDLVKSYTNGFGVDKVIITASTNSNAPMDLAASIVRDRGTICMVGVTDMQIDRRPFYKKEYNFTIARSYGAGRYDTSYEESGVDYPIGYVRFTQGRNVSEFVRLVSEKRLILDDLITHEFDFNNAKEAYELITENPNKESYVGVLLKYPENKEKFNVVVKNKLALSKRHIADDEVRIGMIGAGSFARNTILPIMKASNKYYFRGLATTGGLGASQANMVFPFEYTTNNYQELLSDSFIDLIVISTNHNSHAKIIMDALKADKNVYCEKPLCMTKEELEEIVVAYQESKGELFCGLNRRHAPFIEQIKTKLNTRTIPAVYDYIANAGFIPEDHWTQNPCVGGGRIIGEAVHFIDTIQYLDGSEIISMNTSFVQNAAYKSNDNCFIKIGFESGAVANIVYTSMGSKKYPKEQLRVFSNGYVYEMNNYRKLNIYGSLKKSKIRRKQNKGIPNEYAYIYDVLTGEQKNDAINDVFHAMRFLFQTLERET